MKFLLFTCLILFPLAAQCDPVTLTNASTTFTVPDGMLPLQGAPANGWQYFTDSNGAGVRTMGPMSTTLMPDASSNYGLAWLAQLNTIAFTGAVSFVSRFTLCDGGNCADIAFTGSLGYGTDGLQWLTKPTKQAVALGDVTFDIVPVFSTQTGVVIPQDFGVTLKASSSTFLPTSPVPEPATLFTLSGALALLARRLRKKV